MEYNKYTIDDYERFLEIKSGIIAYGATLSESYKIDESKGIVDEYLPIIDELYSRIVNTTVVPFNGNDFYLAYALNDYTLEQNCFIKKLTLTVFTKSSFDSNFLASDVEILTNSMKITNVKLRISIKEKDLKSERGKEEFYSEMAHELQHVYRFYCILLSNNDSYEEEEKAKMRRYRKANTLMYNTDEDTPQNIISTLYYLSDKNEISSETNRLYEYIRTHEDINYNSYKSVEEELPLFNLRLNLNSGLKKIEGNRENKDFTDEYGTIYKSIIGDNELTPSKALMKLRTRLIYAKMFADRNYYRTLRKAFEDFNRKPIKKRNPFNESIDFDIIDKKFKNYRYEMLNNNVL